MKHLFVIDYHGNPENYFGDPKDYRGGKPKYLIDGKEVSNDEYKRQLQNSLNPFREIEIELGEIRDQLHAIEKEQLYYLHKPYPQVNKEAKQ